MGDVININTERIKKQYEDAATVNINLALDNVIKKKVERDIRKDMIKGYLKLLSK